MAQKPACPYDMRNNVTGRCTKVLQTGNLDPLTWLRLQPAGHLYDGLTWLLRAAQEWDLQRQLALGAPGYNVQVIAMDSVFLRARTLFEFFLGTGSNYAHAECLFGLGSTLSYSKYSSSSMPGVKSWKYALHNASVHLQDRDNSAPVTALDGTTKHLNEMPAEFGRGVLQVWEKFEAELLAGSLEHVAAQKCRTQAIEDSHDVVDYVACRAGAYRAKLILLTPLF